MIKNIKALTASSFISMFFLGVSASLIGAAARSIGLSPFEIGLLLAVQNVGFAIAVAVAGTLSDTYEKPKILLVGSLCLGISFLLFYAIELFWLNLILIFLIGAGTATYEGVTDTMLFDLYTRRQSFYINVNHFFVTFGSLIIALYLTFIQVNWRNSIIQSGVVVLLLAVFFALAKLKNKNPQTEGFLQRFKTLTGERVVIVLFVLVALVVGAELGSIGIISTFLTELRGFSQVEANAGLVMLLVGIATGRLFVGFFAKENQIVLYIIALLGLSLLFFTVLFFIDLNSLTYVIIFLTGVALSALTPLLITLAGLLYNDIAGTVLGAIKVAMPIGGILISFLISIISLQVSFQASLLIFPAIFVAAFFILFFSVRHLAFDSSPIAETTN